MDTWPYYAERSAHRWRPHGGSRIARTRGGAAIRCSVGFGGSPDGRDIVVFQFITVCQTKPLPVGITIICDFLHAGEYIWRQLGISRLYVKRAEQAGTEIGVPVALPVTQIIERGGQV